MAYSKASRAAGKLFHKSIFRKEKEKKNDVYRNSRLRKSVLMPPR